MPLDLTARQAQYVDRLGDLLRGHLHAGQQYAEAFRALPRHWFVRRLFPTAGGAPERISPQTDDERLLDYLYRDHALPVQMAGGQCTSSTTQPSLMAEMMADVGIAPGMRVLEVGTATGWNAAILALIVGEAGHVATIECDRALADEARQNIERVGLSGRVTVRCGDGLLGAADLAPFDAMIVTVGCPDVAAAWRLQLAEGGRLSVPFALPDTSAPILAAERRGDMLVGGFRRWSWFVPMRGGRVPSWPAPLEPERDHALAAVLREPPRRRHLPGSHLDLGLWLLFGQPTRYHAVASPVSESGDRCRQALWDGASSLALIERGEIVGFGQPTMPDLASEEMQAWLDAGAPMLSDHRVLITAPNARPGGRAVRRAESDVCLSGERPS